MKVSEPADLLIASVCKPFTVLLRVKSPAPETVPVAVVSNTVPFTWAVPVPERVPPSIETLFGIVTPLTSKVIPTGILIRPVPAPVGFVTDSVPPVIVVAPVKVFAPLSVSVPGPAFVIPKPTPLTTADTVRSLAAVPSATVKVRVAPSPRLPATVAPIAPPPWEISVTSPPRVSTPTPVVTLAPLAVPLSSVSVPIVSLKPFRS